MLRSDILQECTASIFRANELVQMDAEAMHGKISVDYICGFDRIWLITIMEGECLWPSCFQGMHSGLAQSAHRELVLLVLGRVQLHVYRFLCEPVHAS